MLLELVNGCLLRVLGRDALAKLAQTLTNTISLFRHLRERERERERERMPMLSAIFFVQ